MIVLTQKRIENFSAGIICAVPLFIFCPTKFPRLMRTIAKSIVVGYSIFSTCVLQAQTSTSEFEDLTVEYEPSLLGSSYTPFQAEQFNSYIGQGISQQELGQHDEALIFFEKAWEIDRIQNGLYSQSQVPIIENIISSYVELAQWDSVNEKFDYLEHLYGKIFEFDTPEFALGLQKIASWHVDALNENLDGNRLMHLRKAHNIFKVRLDIARLTLEPGDPMFEYLSENIAISKRQLYLYSGMGGEIAYAQALPLGQGLVVNLD